MKKIQAVAILAGMMAVQSVFGLGVTITGGPGGYGPWQTGLGGEFTLQTDGTWDPAANYASTTSNQGVVPSFQSFCVEGKEFIDPNTSYSVQLNDHTVFSGNALSKGAALLYSQFAQGTLAGYDFGAGRLGSAGLLQNAIWHLMGGQEGLTAYDASNPFEAYVVGILGSDAAASAAAGGDNLGVYVMNLTDAAGGASQDMLVYLPNPNSVRTPDGGTTLMLLGMGLSGLGFVSRRIRR